MPWTKVFTDKTEFDKALAKEGLRGITFREALREAQARVLRRDPRAFIMGEGIDDPGGVFGSTLGLHEEFGKDRIMDIPIAENGLTGIAIGAAASGMRPIFVHMRMDFLPMCMDQIVNHAAKWSYMTGGRVHIPLVIRSIIGRGWGSAAQHSQALHSLFIHIPGLKVVMPATPYDAKGLLMASVEDGNPVMFVEHRWLYERVGYVPEEDYTVPIGQGVIRRQGGDITIVALSQMLYDAMKASDALAAEGIEAEVIDPRSIKPLDIELILNSVQKTGRLVIADVSSKTGSITSEISSSVAEAGFGFLRAPILRVNFPDVPTPASPVLENAFYPSSVDIIKAVKKAMEYAG